MKDAKTTSAQFISPSSIGIIMFIDQEGHRGLVGLFVNKFIRCQGSRDQIPVILILLFVNVSVRTVSKLA